MKAEGRLWLKEGNWKLEGEGEERGLMLMRVVKDHDA